MDSWRCAELGVSGFTLCVTNASMTGKFLEAILDCLERENPYLRVSWKVQPSNQPFLF